MAPEASAWPPARVWAQVLTALPEVMIVSVECADGTQEAAIFQGALIRVPNHGSGPSAAGLSARDFEQKLEDNNPRDYLLADYPSLAQRHTYFQPKPTGGAPASGSVDKLGQSAATRKLGVRLRARQVLCNHCKNVCNEKGDNVQTARHEMGRRGWNRPDQSHRAPSKVKINRNNTLVPKLKRLNQSDIDRLSDRSSDGCEDPTHEVEPPQASGSQTSPTVPPRPPGPGSKGSLMSVVAKPLKIKLSGNVIAQTAHTAHTVKLISPAIFAAAQPGNQRPLDPPAQPASVAEGGRNLRKKRCALGSMEDLWDETIFEDVKIDPSQRSRPLPAGTAQTSSPQLQVLKESPAAESGGPGEETTAAGVPGTKLLKIFYGSQGKETVLKIPASQFQPSTSAATSQPEVEENEENAESLAKKSRDASKKAAKKALKRAKKEAQRRALYGSASPGSYLGGRSPAYRGGRSPIPSPARLMSPFAHPGGFSPGRYGYSPAYTSYSPVHSKSPAYSVSLPQSSPNALTEQRKIIVRKIKHKRKKHKKRKGEEEEDTEMNIEEEGVAMSPCDQQDMFVADEVISSGQLREHWGSFPPFVHVFQEEIPDQTVDSAQMENGLTMCVQNVVWGRIASHPWWPGKVVNIYLKSLTPGGQIRPEALVLWFGGNQTTTSLFPCERLRLFHEAFKDCYSQSASKNSVYKSAIRAATQEVGGSISLPSPTVTSSNPPSSPASQLKSAPTSNKSNPSNSPSPGSFSPRPVDCIS